MKNINSILKILLNPGVVFALSLLILMFILFANSYSKGRQATSTWPTPPQAVTFPNLSFRDVTLESGIDFRHVQGGMKLNAISEVIGSGACTADVNNDGYLDIYAVNGSGFTHHFGKKWWWYEGPQNKLFLNNRDGTFSDVTEKSGAGAKAWGMGCAFADYDNDGYPDLYITNYGANVLYHNNGDGTFTDVTEKAGVGNNGWGTSVIWGDYNNDGYADIYVANYLKFDKTMTPGEPNRAFKVNRPLLMNSALFDSQKNLLYRNNGNGTFTDVADQAGVSNSPGKSMGALFSDFNNDGFMDIYVVNDNSRNVLYKNNGDETFVDVGSALKVDSPLSGMGAAAGDYDNDGDMDIFSTYTQSETNILYRNNLISVSNHEIRNPKNIKGFSDVTIDSGIGENVSVGYFGWGTGFVDFNNDGYLDYFVANGHPAVDFDNPQATIGQKNQVFINNRAGVFIDISRDAGAGMQLSNPSRGTVFGDFDNDGDVDIFLTNNNDYAVLLKNERENNGHWLNIKLQGTNSNRDALGARVMVVSGNLKQIREVKSGSGYLSQSDIRLHFGLADFEKADLIEIMWPSGKKQVLKDVPANRFVTIVEGETLRQVSPEQSRRAQGDNTKGQGGRSVKASFSTGPGQTPLNHQGGLSIDDIKALGILKDKRGTEILIELLQNEKAEIRKEAAAAIGNLEDKRGVWPLLVLLNNENGPGVIKEVIKALSSFENDRIIAPLIHALEGDKLDIKREAAKSLSLMLEREQTIFRSTMLRKRVAVVPLIKALKDADESIRDYAVKGLGFSESYRAVVPVVSMFQDESTLVRKSAARASGLLKDKRAVTSLLDMLGNNKEDAGVRVQAVFALHRLNSETLLEPIFDLVGPDNDSRYRAVSVLTALLRDKESFLLNKKGIISYTKRGIKDPDFRVRKEVIKISFLLGNKRNPDIILAGLNDKNDEVRREAARAANESKNEKLSEVLKGLTDDKDPSIRREALLSLAIHASKKEKSLLKKIAADKKENIDIRLAALNSLAKTDSAAAIKIVVEFLKKDDLRVKRECIKILGLINDKKVIKPLLSYLEKPGERMLVEESVLAVGKFLNEKEVFYALVKKMKDKTLDKDIRLAILTRLSVVSRSEKIFPYLINIIKDRSDDLKLDALKVIAAAHNSGKGEVMLKKLFEELISES